MAVREGFEPIPNEPKASSDVTEARPNRRARPKAERMAVREGFEPSVEL